MSDIDLVKKVRVYAEEAEKNGFEVLTVPLRDLFPLLGRMEAAERRVAELENDESRQRLANAEHQLYMKDLAINNIKASRRAQFKKRQAAERERDELRAEQAEHDGQIARMESKFSLAKRALDSKTARCEKAEAELARRDAAAGECAGVVTGYAVNGCVVSSNKLSIGDHVYTAAPAAVLPTEKITEIMQDAWNEFCDDTGCYPDDFEYQNEQLFFDAGRWAMLVAERISSLGAQQQKVVALPGIFRS